VEVWLHEFFTSALDGGEWSPYPQGKSPGIHWTGGWLAPRTVLDAMMKRKIPSTCRESNPRTPIVQPLAQRYTDWAISLLIIHSDCNFLSFCRFNIANHSGQTVWQTALDQSSTVDRGFETGLRHWRMSTVFYIVRFYSVQSDIS
jgi:hypothetical protein